jgi:hypothetical protein
LPNSLFPSAHRCTHNLAGAAAPPPSGAGRRRGTGVPLDSLVACASSPATRCTNPWSFWWPGAPSRGYAGEPPPRTAAQPAFPACPPPHLTRARSRP